MQLGQGFRISDQKPEAVQDNMGSTIDHHNNQRMGGEEEGREREREKERERKITVVPSTQSANKDVADLVAL